MILINECYGPVYQGEGRTAGKPVVFLRLSACNLACSWCDTPFTWNFLGSKWLHPDKYDMRKEVHRMSVDEVKAALYQKANGLRSLVISGGEPMLQQTRLIPLLKELKKDNWWVEIETNGTIEPLDEFVSLINQFNCSPKTSNSGLDNPLEKRFILSALLKLKSLPITTFKFVVQTDVDVVEIQRIIHQAKIDPSQVWLMPEGKTREEQEEREDVVRDIAECNGYHFSPRLHVLEYGNMRGV
jgi:7-carboxy-7-deazaguanine synthase